MKPHSWRTRAALGRLIIDGEYPNALREGMIVFYLMFPLHQNIISSINQSALTSDTR